MTTSEPEKVSPVNGLLGEIGDCTGQIEASAESIARIYDEDTALSELQRVRGALEVATFYLMRVEAEAKGETEP